MAEDDDLWNNLPSLIIVKILSYLSSKDRLRATAVCRNWRANLFHPTLWRNVTFNLSNCDTTQGALFWATKCGTFVHRASIEVGHATVEDVNNILDSLMYNSKLRALSITPLFPQRGTQYCKKTKSTFLHKLCCLFRTSECLESVSIGLYSIQAPIDVLGILYLYQTHSLKRLHVANCYPGNINYNTIGPVIGQFAMLQELVISHEHVDTELVMALAETSTLKKLIIYVVTSASNFTRVGDDDWRHLTLSIPKLEVGIKVIHQHLNIIHMLSPMMPLAHLHMFFMGGLDDDFVYRLSAQNHSTLKTFSLVDQLNEKYSVNRSFGMSRIDPLVMLAWKCRSLTKLKVFGYEVPAESLVAIARLRGPQLKELSVPATCISTNQMEEAHKVQRSSALNSLCSQVSEALQTSWTPVWNPEDCHWLHPDNVNSFEVYLPTLIADQAW